MNTFNLLPLEEAVGEITIENDNQCRNKKKLLDRKKEKCIENPSPELKKQIKILTCEINEYENKNLIPQKKKKKKNKSREKESIELNLLNQLSKKNQKLKHKQMIKEQQIKKLWKESNGYPQWSPEFHKLFPLHDKKCIMILLLGKNNPECILNIIPNEIIDNILSNLHWDWFYIQKKKHVRRKKMKNKKNKLIQ